MISLLGFLGALLSAGRTATALSDERHFLRKEPSRATEKAKVFSYNICNGFSNQLLYHAAAIANAASEGFDVVEIPDHYILFGVQTSYWQNILPAKNNTLPFGHMFDQEFFLSTIQNATGLEARLVDMTLQPNATACKGMDIFNPRNSALVAKIVAGFRPSKCMNEIIDLILQELNFSISDGVCLHHRDGQDWHDHCKRWHDIYYYDHVYRGNCLAEYDQDTLHAIQYRGLHKPGRWLFYAGDHAIPSELVNATTQTDGSGQSLLTGAISRPEILRRAHINSTLIRLLAAHEKMVENQYGIPKIADMNSITNRDFWSFLDFFVCRRLPTFIGNSVSSFSAIQIALRQTAYWYNSQYIPLSDIWHVYQFPIVYTYTELSAIQGKFLLQASIESVHSLMPDNQIHILYHTDSQSPDTIFRSWLKDRGVIIHDHNPSWIRDIERMRKTGNRTSSHLFQHAGNYLGTWQRIDVPHFIESEYALLLDADTVLHRPFIIKDFGPNLTHSIAMSSELTKTKTPSNAGVMLMNIPNLRKSYNAFLKFILDHSETKGHFGHASPSDQGAYLTFYNTTIQFLPYTFNTKPYFELPSDPNKIRFKIFHFHGPKPHDYLNRLLFGKSCDVAFDFLCIRTLEQTPNALCRGLTLFARATLAVDNSLAYCDATMSNPQVCRNLFVQLVDRNGDHCTDFLHFLNVGNFITETNPYYIKSIMRKEAQERKKRKEQLLKNLSFRHWINQFRTADTGMHSEPIFGGILGMVIYALTLLGLLLFLIKNPKLLKGRRLGAIGIFAFGLACFSFYQTDQLIRQDLQTQHRLSQGRSLKKMYHAASLELSLLDPETNFSQACRSTVSEKDGLACCDALKSELGGAPYRRLNRYRSELSLYEDRLATFDIIQHTERFFSEKRNLIRKHVAQFRKRLSNTLDNSWDIREFRGPSSDTNICQVVNVQHEKILQTGVSKISRRFGMEALEPVLPFQHFPLGCDTADHQSEHTIALVPPFLVHDFAMICRQLQSTSRIALYVLGSSPDLTSSSSPLCLLIKLFERFGFPYDAVYDHSIYNKVAISTLMEKIPTSILSGYQKVTTNQLDLSSFPYKASDMVTIAVDLKDSEPLVRKLINDPSRALIVDNFYIKNIAVDQMEKANRWLLALRSVGIAAHALY